MTDTFGLIDKLNESGVLNRDELIYLIENRDEKSSNYLRKKAREKCDSVYGNKVYIRGLIEFTNYCKNDCYYCGIRRSNKKINRYRLDADTILQCCLEGSALGFKTFVLQGGEDRFFDDDKLCELINKIKKSFPDCAVTLSIGERSYTAYKKLYDAGADRYLLRHETISEEHYKLLHPKSMSYNNRIECLSALKEIGFQTGCGFMVGSPYQTTENLADELLFIKKFMPHMVGIGPYIPHKDTPFSSFPAGNVGLTLFLLSLIRLFLPEVLLPATTALGTIENNGREYGILHGANVIMPNLSPVGKRKDYSLYNNKASFGCESAEGLSETKKRIEAIGYEIVNDIGHSKIK